MNKNDTDKNQSSAPLKMYRRKYINPIFALLLFMLIGMASSYFGTLAETVLPDSWPLEEGQDAFSLDESSLKSIDVLIPGTSVFLGEMAEEEVEDEDKKNTLHGFGLKVQPNLPESLSLPTNNTERLVSSIPLYVQFCSLKLPC